MLAKGRWHDLDLNPHLFYRRPICAARGVNEKNTISFRILLTRGRCPLLGTEAKERKHLKETGLYSTGTWNLEKNPPCNVEDNLSAGLIIIEAWFGGY